ncbi:MAG TPA: hypothetical protein VFQ50_05010 [Flavobacterium sp.]|nr:hypothetical protein [Flavobacterium sp.]
MKVLDEWEEKAGEVLGIIDIYNKLREVIEFWNSISCGSGACSNIHGALRK